MSDGVPSVAARYASERAYFLGVLDGLGPDSWETRVPATPLWTVREVVAHVTGICVDVPAGRVEGAPGDAWTAAQVAARARATPAEILAEWQDGLPAFLAMLEAAGDDAANLAVDVTLHHQDVREALGESPGTHTETYPWVRDGLVVAGSKAVHRAGLPSLRVRAGEVSTVLGRTEPVATLTVDHYELARGVAGRRSLASMRGWDWDGVDPEPYVAVLPHFPPPAD